MQDPENLLPGHFDLTTERLRRTDILARKVSCHCHGVFPRCLQEKVDSLKPARWRLPGYLALRRARQTEGEAETYTIVVIQEVNEMIVMDLA